MQFTITGTNTGAGMSLCYVTLKTYMEINFNRILQSYVKKKAGSWIRNISDPQLRRCRTDVKIITTYLVGNCEFEFTGSLMDVIEPFPH
jgi:hypothetical protein